MEDGTSPLFMKVENSFQTNHGKKKHKTPSPASGLELEEDDDEDGEEEEDVIKLYGSQKKKHHHHHHHHHHHQQQQQTNNNNSSSSNNNNKNHGKKILRRRSSLSAELEAVSSSSSSFDSPPAKQYYAEASPTPINSDKLLKKKTQQQQQQQQKNHENQLLNSHQNVHSSMSLLSVSTTNNAITIVPSRRTELNVFDTRIHKRHHRRRRAATPEPALPPSKQYPVGSKEDNLQSVLSKLDRRIKNNFGDWSTMDDDSNFEYRNVGRHNNGGGGGGGLGRESRQAGTNSRNNATTTTTSSINNAWDSNNSSWNNGYLPVPTPTTSSAPDGGPPVSLPPLYKNYHAVLKSSKGKLLDRSQRIALSKDNNDPNSILSEAKRTLTNMGTSVRD